MDKSELMQRIRNDVTRYTDEFERAEGGKSYLTQWNDCEERASDQAGQITSIKGEYRLNHNFLQKRWDECKEQRDFFEKDYRRIQAQLAKAF